MTANPDLAPHSKDVPGYPAANKPLKINIDILY